MIAHESILHIEHTQHYMYTVKGEIFATFNNCEIATFRGVRNKLTAILNQPHPFYKPHPSARAFSTASMSLLNFFKPIDI